MESMIWSSVLVQTKALVSSFQVSIREARATAPILRHRRYGGPVRYVLYPRERRAFRPAPGALSGGRAVTATRLPGSASRCRL